MSFAVIDVSTGVIHGTGDTVAEAAAEAACWCNRESGALLASAPIYDDASNIREQSRGWAIVPATESLIDAVIRRGGDVRWRIERGTIELA